MAQTVEQSYFNQLYNVRNIEYQSAVVLPPITVPYNQLGNLVPQSIKTNQIMMVTLQMPLVDYENLSSKIYEMEMETRNRRHNPIVYDMYLKYKMMYELYK